MVTVGLELPNDRRALVHALNALVAVDLDILRRHRGAIPSLYDARIPYAREKRGPSGRRREHWQNILGILKRGKGDCEDLAAWRVAELLYRGVKARIWLRRISPTLWHVLVRHPDGTLEDPSAKLGMPTSPRDAANKRARRVPPRRGF